MSVNTADSTTSPNDTTPSINALMMALAITTADPTDQSTISNPTVSNATLSAPLPAEIRNHIFFQSHVIKNKDGSMKILDIKTLKFYWRRALGAAHANSALYNTIMPIFFGNHVFTFEQWYEATVPGQYQAGRQTDLTKFNGKRVEHRVWKGAQDIPRSGHVFTRTSSDGLHAQHIQVLPPHLMAQIRHAEITFYTGLSNKVADAVKGNNPQVQPDTPSSHKLSRRQHTRLAHWVSHIADLHGLGFRDLQSLRIVVDDPRKRNGEHLPHRIRELLTKVVHQVAEFEVLFHFYDRRTKEHYVAAEEREHKVTYPYMLNA